MGIKQKLGLGAASAVLGLSLIGGGTYAYFSDTAEATATFAAGTLDLSVDPTQIIDVSNMKPGDTVERSFKLVNGGSLDIAKISLKSSYTVSDANGNNTEDFGKHIRVVFLDNTDKVDTVVWDTTLDKLSEMSPDVIEGNVFSKWLGERGGKLEPKSSDLLKVKFEFVDNKKDQNQFQGDSLELKWEFEAKQGRPTRH